MIVTRSNFKAPVAFFVFRRAECSAKVLGRIREYRPPKLFLVADGPRQGRADDAVECERTRRAVLDAVDWNCEVISNFSDENLGCKERLSSGLDWVFSQTEEAIILEDDCLPSGSFFDFCNTMLTTYRDETSVLHIGGTSPLSKMSESSAYRFTRYNRIWGWANWSRSWRHFDKDIGFWPEYKDSGELMRIFSQKEAIYWTKIFDKVYAGEIDTWDYQWFLCRLRQGVAIEPAVNLVSNIGFGHDGTNTKNSKHQLAELVAGDFRFPAQGPESISVDRSQDLKWWKHLQREGSLLGRFVRKLGY